MPGRGPDSNLFYRVQARIGRGVRLATELASTLDAIQREMGRLFSSTRGLPPQQQAARIAELLRFSPDLTEQLRLLARVLADARAAFDHRVKTEGWLRKLLDEELGGSAGPGTSPTGDPP